MTVTLIDADPADEFNYPYYLNIPESLRDEGAVPILVEPTNMPGPTDDFEAHRGEARQRASSGFGRRVADELSVPFLHPVFPRPASDPVDWSHYTHQLDPETLRIDNSPLERIDLQLLEMVEDARNRLSDQGISTMDRFLMNGFSASGTFVNRFSALHPNKLISASAGGLNGMAILPMEETEIPVEWIAESELPYPVGTGNIGELTGEPFDLKSFCDVHQFLYLGENDQNDTLLYPDAWTEPELRGIAILVYGEDIHEERFPYCKAVYEEVNVSAVFRQYKDTGHKPTPAMEDIVEFHERSLGGDDIESIRSDLGANVPNV